MVCKGGVMVCGVGRWSGGVWCWEVECDVERWSGGVGR